MITALIIGTADAAEQRFIPLDHDGQPRSAKAASPGDEWPCVRDRNTELVWEVKSRHPGRHYRLNTYRWFDSDSNRNGGFAGGTEAGHCHPQKPDGTGCDTQSFIHAVNAAALCGAQDWRLPRREELRSLVDYRTPSPGPTIDTRAFPNATSQFYWSADTAAAEASEAWGIGFAFGFDYAYYKSNRVHVRLVRGERTHSISAKLQAAELRP